MGGGGVGGSKRKRPNDVVGEKIDMFVAPWMTCWLKCWMNCWMRLTTPSSTSTGFTIFFDVNVG